jgi:hypothetical protein
LIRQWPKHFSANDDVARLTVRANFTFGLDRECVFGQGFVASHALSQDITGEVTKAVSAHHA